MGAFLDALENGRNAEKTERHIKRPVINAAAPRALTIGRDVVLVRRQAQLGAVQAPHPNLPPLIEELIEREFELVAGVARGLTNQGIGSSLDISGGNCENPRGQR